MLDDPTFFDHVTRTADGRGAADILFDEQERNPRVPHARERFENLRHHHRSEAFGWLVDQQELRRANQGTANRQNLLLAAGRAENAVRASAEISRILDQVAGLVPPSSASE